MKSCLFVFLLLANIVSAQGVRTLNDVTLDDAIKMIAVTHNYNLSVEAPIPDVKVTVDVRGPLNASLEKILKPNGLAAVVSTNVVHIRYDLNRRQPEAPAYHANSYDTGYPSGPAPMIYSDRDYDTGYPKALPPPVTYDRPNYYPPTNYYGGGYNPYYGYYSPLLEPCLNFPGNRVCVMGKIKIDLEQLQGVIVGILKSSGLSPSTEVDMYSSLVDEKTHEVITLPVNEGSVTAHNNWFNNPYRIEAGTYMVQFVTKKGKNFLFRDYIKVRPEYLTRGEVQKLTVSAGRFKDEPDRGFIEKPERPTTITLQDWRKGGSN